MLDAAFASFANGFSARFGAPFVDAVAKWPGTPVTDAGGSIVTPAVPVEYSCRAQFDAPTQAMRAAEGFLETDARILVLADSLEVPLDTNASIIADGVKWALLTCQRDAAGIGYECRGRKVV